MSESFFNKLLGWRSLTLLKRNTNAVVFQWNLQNFSEHLLLRCEWLLLYLHPNGHTRRIQVGSTWILRRDIEVQILTNFHVVSAYFFDVISMFEKSTLLPRTFISVIPLVEKSTLFARSFLDAISLVEICVSFYLLFSM